MAKRKTVQAEVKPVDVRHDSARREVAAFLAAGTYPLYAEDDATFGLWETSLAEFIVAKAIFTRFNLLTAFRAMGCTMHTIQQLVCGDDSFLSDRMLSAWWLSGIEHNFYRPILHARSYRNLFDLIGQYEEGQIDANPDFDAYVREHLICSMEDIANHGMMTRDAAERLTQGAKRAMEIAKLRQEGIQRQQAELERIRKAAT